MVFEEVLEDEEMLSFFTDEMNLTAATITQIQFEGISTPKDLADFYDTDIKQLADNRTTFVVPQVVLRKRVGDCPRFCLWSEFPTTCDCSRKLIRFYKMIGRPLTMDCIVWDPVFANFQEQWEALEKREKEDDPAPPQVSRSLPIIRWTECFKDYLHRVIGKKMVPLAYIIRAHVKVSSDPGDREHDQPFRRRMDQLRMN